MEGPGYARRRPGILIIATIATKNLPALLEILLLQRVSITSGSRFTIKTLTGYVIVAIAALMVFGILGLSWSQVQWLVAALGVGNGFGLQEIVANFISGLITLFERPIRVGDVVSIGDTTGAVSKIRIRATTIRRASTRNSAAPASSSPSPSEMFTRARRSRWTCGCIIPLPRYGIPPGRLVSNDLRCAAAGHGDSFGNTRDHPADVQRRRPDPEVSGSPDQ